MNIGRGDNMVITVEGTTDGEFLRATTSLGVETILTPEVRQIADYLLKARVREVVRKNG